MRKATLLLMALACLAAWPAEASERLGYVLPGSPGNHAINQSSTNTKSPSQLPATDSPVQSPNLTNGFLSDSGSWLFDAPRGSTLPGHVRSIVHIGPQKQMLVSDARRIVALVADTHTVRDWAEVNLPRNAVSPFHHASAYTESAVASRKATGSPRPAWSEFRAHDGAVFIDLGPEAFKERFVRASLIATSLAAVAPFSATKSIRFNLKRPVADGADGNHIPSNQGQSVSSDLAGAPIGDTLFADQASQVKIENTSHHQAQPLKSPTAKSGFQKFLTVALYPFTPYRRDSEDRVMNWLNGAYVGTGYVDLYTTFRALNASPTIRETSPIFGTYFTGRPHPVNAFLVHTGVNYAFLSGIRYAHNWAHDRNSQSQGKWKRASEYVLWGLVVGLTVDRARVANNNRKLAARYGK